MEFLGAYVSKCGYANAILFGHKFGYLLACKVSALRNEVKHTGAYTGCCRCVCVSVCARYICVNAKMEIEFTRSRMQ